MRLMRLTTAFVLGGALLCGAPALAHDDHFDIGVAILNGRLVTGAVEEGATIDDVLANPARLWAAELDFEGVAAEPGFYGPAGTFAPGGLFGYNVRGPMLRWTGAGFVEATERMVLTFPGQGNVVVPGPGGAGTIVPGHTFAAEPDGGFDDHPFYNLLTQNFEIGALPGAYLVELELRADGLITSEPFWILFNNDLSDEAFDAAFDYVLENIVPAPGALAMFGLAALGATRRRRC